MNQNISTLIENMIISMYTIQWKPCLIWSSGCQGRFIFVKNVKQESVLSKFWQIAEPQCMVWIHAPFQWYRNEVTSSLLSAFIVIQSILLSEDRVLTMEL